MKKVEVVILINNLQGRQAQTSLMEKFKDPKSSASSEDYKSEIVSYPKIIRNPADAIIQQVIETKFLSNTDRISHINHDSEMVDQHQNSQSIIKKESEIRIIKSDVSGETSNRYWSQSAFSPKPPLIGKSTRSRNIQDTIKASRESADSPKGLMSKNFNEGDVAIDKTMENTLNKVKNRKKNNHTTMEVDPSHEELSDFETFRNLESEVSKAFKGGFDKNHRNNQLINKHSSEVKQSKDKIKIEEKPTQVRRPKLMNLFENNQGASRNTGLMNKQSESVKLGICSYSYFYR